MYRPRSIVRLILLGFALVLTPLIAAVVIAVVQVDRLAQGSRLAVLEAGMASEQSRALVEQLTEMQRAFGQYEVRGDRDFYEIYLERRKAFRNALENLVELSATDLGDEELRALEQQEAALFEDLGRESGRLGGNMTAEQAASELAALGNRARAIFARSSRLIEDQANSATERAEDVQRQLLLVAAATIPAAVLLAAIFVVLITRPMGQLGQAIRRLGAREMEAPITVSGPRDLEALGRQLDWLRRRIQELEQQKTAFLRHISHELKTPLTTIREGSQLLVESLAKGAPEEAEISRLMCTNSLHLQKLIEDLLQFAKTQELNVDLKLEDDIDMRELIRSAVATQSVASGSKGVVIEQRLDPIAVRGDPKKIRIVVDNLLSNAIKYTPRGGRISISLAADPERAIVEVLDSGPGIDPGEREKIFEPFQQGHADYQSSVKGTGLGLAIAKEYVEAHDGCIKVIASGSGARFCVELPLAGPADFAA